MAARFLTISAATSTHNSPFKPPPYHHTLIDTKARNIVGGGSVGMRIDMGVASQIPHTTYDPTAFPGVRFRLNDTTTLLFDTGKVVIVGATSSEAVYAAMNMLADILKKHNIPIGHTTCKIHNVVATASFGRTIDLARVVINTPHSLYEPEHFPGVIMRRRDPKCTILLFASGKLVCVGANSVEAASAAINTLYTDLVRGGIL